MRYSGICDGHGHGYGHGMDRTDGWDGVCTCVEGEMHRMDWLSLAPSKNTIDCFNIQTLNAQTYSHTS